MSREVLLDPELHCDQCHIKGAYDFMGDYLCADCADLPREEDEWRDSDDHLKRNDIYEFMPPAD